MTVDNLFQGQAQFCLRFYVLLFRYCSSDCSSVNVIYGLTGSVVDQRSKAPRFKPLLCHKDVSSFTLSHNIWSWPWTEVAVTQRHSIIYLLPLQLYGCYGVSWKVQCLLTVCAVVSWQHYWRAIRELGCGHVRDTGILPQVDNAADNKFSPTMASMGSSLCQYWYHSFVIVYLLWETLFGEITHSFVTNCTCGKQEITLSPCSCCGELSHVTLSLGSLVGNNRHFCHRVLVVAGDTIVVW